MPAPHKHTGPFSCETPSSPTRVRRFATLRAMKLRCYARQNFSPHRLGPDHVLSIQFHWCHQTAAVISLLTMPVAQLSEEQDHRNHSMMHQNHHQKNSVDLRTPLNLPPQMAQHQLSNMRGHLEAVQKIVSLMAKNNFEEASNTA